MNLALDIFFCVAAVIALVATGLEYRRCLTMLQQNSYVNSRYRTWLSQSGDTTSAMRLLGIAVVLVGMALTLSTVNWRMLLVIIWAIPAAWQTASIRYKKPLVMTRRAWRIAVTMAVLSVAVIVGMWLLFRGDGSPRRGMFVVALTAVALYCASHIVTMAANWLLGPVERSINARYRRDAQRILAGMPGLKVVGITGSYGKTSTKHFLHRILSEQFDTLMTPGNFNTTLGVIRTVREQLKPYNEVFIVEMGAKNVGDIADICRLVRPTAGIVTAVGPQHLETFKTLENVQRTKFELVDALPADGVAVINNDFGLIASRAVGNTRAVRYAVAHEGEAAPAPEVATVTDVRYAPGNTRFTLRTPDGREATFTTRLLGEANISDLAAAILMARELGVPDDKISYAVEQIEPVEHRLSVKRTPAGITIVDDAYNSNPVGSAMAMDVLRRMECAGRRIVVTPGMVELGDEQYDLNRTLGTHIAKAADKVVVVNRLNRDAILEGLRQAGFPEADVLTADSFAEAQQMLAGLLTPGDTVLYENDLPDTFK